MDIKNITAVVIGNALEWYDFVIYSFMTQIIAHLFFPAEKSINSILAATATFGVAFCIRPLGGILLGIYSDKKGRKAAISLVISIMTLALLMISLSPTYVQIGALAPCIIVFARMLQGFSAGGEFGVSTALLIELAPLSQRGYYGSWQMVGQILAMLLGSLVGLLVTHLFTAPQIESFAWRIPFIIGLIIAPVGIYIRNHLSEPAVDLPHLSKSRQQTSDLVAQIKTHWQQILVAMGLLIGGTVAVYVNISYLPTFASLYLHLPISHAFIILALVLLLLVILIPIFGYLSDHLGRKPILVTAIALYLCLSYPLFYWLTSHPTSLKLFVVELCSCLLLAPYFGVFAVTVAELFPIPMRSLGLGISYNLVVMLFGGFAQFIVTWLIKILHTPLAISYYLLFAMFLSLLAAICYRQQNSLP